jgi:DNA-directed RNA polymerase specialized sigma24 family protein
MTISDIASRCRLRPDVTAMYVAYADRVFAYLCTQLGPQEAEELTAQAFCEAWRQRATCAGCCPRCTPG